MAEQTSYYEAGLLSNTSNHDVTADQTDESDASDQDGSSRKRKRAMNVTCEACKQRKVKCGTCPYARPCLDNLLSEGEDRVQPACGWCSKNQHPCEYKERKKPGLRAGYGRELEGRLDKLETLLHDQGRQLAAHLAACGLADQSALVSQGISHLTSVRHAQFDASPALSYEEDNTIKHQHVIDPQLRPAGTRQSSLQYPLDHPNQPVHRLSDVSPAHTQLTSPRSTAAHSAVAHTQTFDHTTSLPPHDFLYTLVEVYFRHINIWFPLLEKKSTLNTLFGQTPRAEADTIVLHAIVAVSLRFSNDVRLSPESRQQYHDASKQKVQLYGLENSSVRALQALVILALDVTGNTNGPPGWNLLALISRSIVQLGLAAEATSSLAAPLYPSIATLRASVLPEPSTPVEDEERRRLFWTVYMLDRYATVATAFEFALDDREIDRRLPCRDDLFATNKAVETKFFRQSGNSGYGSNVHDVHGNFAYHCELLGILSRIHLFLKRPIDIESLQDVEQWQASYRALDGELNAWHFGLPDEYANVTRLIKSNSPARALNCGWVMVQAAYALVTIRLNSSAAYPSQSSSIFSSSYSAMQRCLSAVDHMRQLSQLVKTSGLLEKMGPPFAFSAWVSARVALVHGSIMDHNLDPDIDFFVSLLSDMGQYWDVAQRYSEILGRVLGEYRTSQQAGSERVTPSTVQILADMRRCAYDLDFLISRQPNTSVKSYHPTRANTPAINELEYLDVFDIFNFPRIPMDSNIMPNPASGMTQSVPAQLTSAHPMMANLNFTQPNPETDWLFHAT